MTDTNVRIRLIRNDHVVEDERDPNTIELSRVPRIGEHVSTLGCRTAKEAGHYRVTSVVHTEGEIAARVGVTKG